MNRAHLGTFLALIVMGLAGCAHMSQGRGAGGKGAVVEAEGWSPIDPKDPAATRQRALAEAQRKAVEKAIGVTLSATTKVEEAVTLKQKIEANVGGFIRSYEILSEGREEGFLKIRIRAFVLYQAPEPPKAEPKSTRIAVVVPDQGLSGALRLTLSSRGFPVSDRAEGADIVVTGSAQAYAVPDPRLGGFHSYRARVSLDVLKAATGELSHQTGEASAIDPVEELARESAVARAAELAADALAARLSAKPGKGL